VSTQGGDCEIWYALAATPQNGNLVTATFSNTTSGVFTTFGIAGIDLTNTTGLSAFGATATANNASSSTASVNLTTTRSNSWVFAVGNSSNSNKLNAISAAGMTNLLAHSNSTTSSSVLMMQTAPSGSVGTVVTMSGNSTTATDWNMLAFEVLPSLGHGLSSGNVGV
jgi:hypothetical protein